MGGPTEHGERHGPSPDKQAYLEALHALQVELVKLQAHLMGSGGKLLVLFEGRDAAGKDGVIKRIIAHLRPRDTRVVALGKPSEREQTAWYFQRYVCHLPTAGEFVLFNRSWYNRAGVERVMGFCTEADCEEFLDTVPGFERMLVRSGITLIKYYLDIGRDEQRRRMEARRADPLKAWKLSPVDARAQKDWEAYSRARDEMLARTDSAETPWTIVRSDDKRAMRLNLIRDLLARLDYAGKDGALPAADPRLVFRFDPACLSNGAIAP